MACQNLMLAAEALGFNTCPREGFDRRRLSQHRGLSAHYPDIVMGLRSARNRMATLSYRSNSRALAAAIRGGKEIISKNCGCQMFR